MVIRRQLKRRYVLAFFQKLPPSLIGIEPCASSHHWSRELQALGHTVRLMPPAYVKPYVKRQKNDATDAEAICEAVTRANMRFVPTKTLEQQSGLVLHRTRHLFMRQSDFGDQYDPGPSRRVWDRGTGRTPRRRAVQFDNGSTSPVLVSPLINGSSIHRATVQVPNGLPPGPYQVNVVQGGVPGRSTSR